MAQRPVARSGAAGLPLRDLPGRPVRLARPVARIEGARFVWVRRPARTPRVRGPVGAIGGGTCLPGTGRFVLRRSRRRAVYPIGPARRVVGLWGPRRGSGHTGHNDHSGRAGRRAPRNRPGPGGPARAVGGAVTEWAPFPRKSPAVGLVGGREPGQVRHRAAGGAWRAAEGRRTGVRGVALGPMQLRVTRRDHEGAAAGWRGAQRGPAVGPYGPRSPAAPVGYGWPDTSFGPV